MHVARVALCQLVYEVSGWNETRYWYECFPNGTYHTTICSRDERKTQNSYIPAYDLSYLLRHLPPLWKLEPVAGAMWMITYKPGVPHEEIIVQDVSLEDVVCRLAIELFQRGKMDPLFSSNV